MREEFPVGAPKISFAKKHVDEPGFYDIEFESSMEIPVLPFKKDHNQKLMFVNGTLRGTY
jgi:hypothetical protein